MAVELPYPEAEHASRVICGDPVACGYEWIKRYAENLSDHGSSSGDPDDDDDYYGGSVTAEELIETATTNIEGGGYGDCISKGPLLDGVSVDSIFWDKLADFKQIEIPQDKRNNFFSCSC